MSTSLAAGDHLGPYEIVAAVGSGGMGVVYRARDPRVGRDVAIKVSKETFNPRFEREARTIAGLNHSHIAHLYDVGPNYLVMELVEGETLADRIRKGAIPADEALEIAWQIAEALGAAHDKGVVHRDLKPANIKITPDGMVKVLDFGLAKVAVSNTAAPGDSPTEAASATGAGVILGTAAYMAPEQARGMAADKRSDIWAFGVVLYEMLTGEMLFARATLSDTLAAVLKEEPRWERLPAGLRRLVRTCLQKDPRQRLNDIADARLLVDNAAAAAAAQPHARPHAWMLAAAVLALATAGLSYIHFREPPRSVAAPVRFEIPLPEHARLAATGSFALSPDGRKLLYSGRGQDGVSRLWLRFLDGLEFRPLMGTEASGPLGSAPFFWSPDSRFVMFDGGAVLKRVDVTSGATQTLSELPGIAVGGSWSREGLIIVGNSAGGLLRLSPSGGSVSPLTVLDPSRKEINHTGPLILPGGRHFLYIRSSRVPENAGVYIGSMEAKPEEQGLRKLLPHPSVVQYLPIEGSQSGWLFFHRNEALLAQPFDPRRVELLGEAVRVAEPVGAFIGSGFFSVSSNGVVVYRSGAATQNSRLTWLDRSGRVLGAVGEAARYHGLALSPDGTKAAAALLRLDGFRMLLNIWQIDLSRGTNSRLTFGQLPDDAPVWSSDNSRIVFSSIRDGTFNVYRKELGGIEEQVVSRSRAGQIPASLSRDGRFLLYEVTDPASRRDLWILPMVGGGKPVRLLGSDFNETQGRFSPDARWMAYTSDEAGRNEVYVRAISISSTGDPVAGPEKWMVSKEGGHSPRWRGDGKELIYQASDGAIMAVDVSSDATFRPGVPHLLFPPPRGFVAWDVAADGKRFLFAVAEQPQAPFTVTLNWNPAANGPAAP